MPTKQILLTLSCALAIAAFPAAAQTNRSVEQATAGEMETQNNAAWPMDSWSFVLPAANSPKTPRRSEIWVTVNSSKPPVLSEGKTVVIEADITSSLGAAARSDNDWHVFLQLHGPTARGWPGPVLGLSVRDGRWRLGGGAGHPNHSSRNKMEWWTYLDKYVEGATKRVRMEVKLSSNPSVGYVTLDLDGRRVVDRYRPRAGTWYPDQEELGLKTGLYRGTDAGHPIPKYTQYSETSALKYSVK